MRIFVLIATLLAGFVSAQPKPAVEVDPIVTVWRMGEGKFLRFDGDKTVRTWTVGRRGVTSGKWEHDPFSEGLRRYAVKWENGQEFDLELATDFSAIRGKRKEGEDFAGSRMEDLTVYMMANNSAVIRVNGMQHLRAEFPKVASGSVPMRKGDVITVELGSKGDAELALIVFRGNEPVWDVSKFKYISAADPDWATSPDLGGYQAPVLKPRRNFAMGNVKEPLLATPLKEDGKFKRHFFKYVVP